jgi:hypothetical protein
VLSTKTTPLSIHFGAHYCQSGPKLSSKTIQSISTIVLQMVVNKKRVVAPPGVFLALLQPSLSSVRDAHTPSQNLSGRDARMHLKSLPQKWRGGYPFWTIDASLPCVCHMGVLIRYDKFEVSHFSAFLHNPYLSSLTTTPLRTEACCKWVEGFVMQPRSRIGERSLASAPSTCLHELLSFCRFVKHPNARTYCDWLLPNTNHCPQICGIVLP